MAKVEDIEMSEQWLIDHARDVCMKDAWILIQGAPGSGFARVTSGKLELRLTPRQVADFVPERYWDVRMFGEIGEYHCWMGTDRKWRARFAKRNDPDWKFTTSRSYPLWGTQSKLEGDWIRLSEARGATVWVPAAAVLENKPVMLNARLRLEPDDTGVAGVVDAMLCDFSVGREK